MERVNVKDGQKVRVAATSLFYTHNLGKVGVVTETDGSIIYVTFDDGEFDHGYASDLELVEESTPVEEPTTVKQAIADVEKALAVLKALVG